MMTYNHSYLFLKLILPFLCLIIIAILIFGIDIDSSRKDLINSLQIEIQDDLTGTDSIASVKPKQIENAIIFTEMDIAINFKMEDYSNLISGKIVFTATGESGICIRAVKVTDTSEITKSIKILTFGESVTYNVNSYNRMRDIAFYINKADGSPLGFISLRELIDY